MVPLLQHTLPATISLQTNIAEDLPFVHIDPTQLESAIMNLAINARDAITSDGEIELAASIVNSNKIPGLPHKDRKADGKRHGDEQGRHDRRIISGTRHQPAKDRTRAGGQDQPPDKGNRAHGPDD